MNMCMGIPHTRGDEPMVGQESRIELWYSPHAWG